jgi:hypothetical protein
MKEHIKEKSKKAKKRKVPKKNKKNKIFLDKQKKNVL